MTSPANDFAFALTTWKDINLSALQKSLDASGLEIVENQKENVVGRKKLAEQTREFKKISDEEKVNAFKGLLKAYQSEIDALTKRSKTAESAFLNVYKLLSEAPDPYPLLDAAVDQTARASEARLLESELRRSKEENAGLKKELVEAQGVEKERKKQQERGDKLENKMEEMVKVQVAGKEAELTALYAERINNFQDRERDLTTQVDLARSQLRDLRTSNDSTQARLLDTSSRQEVESAARHAEMEMSEADLERALRRVEEVERRNEKLRMEIEVVRSGSEAQEKVKTLEAQIGELQSEAERLLEGLEVQKRLVEEGEAGRRKEVEVLKASLGKKEGEIKVLKERLEMMKDYDEVKRELEIMKYVEFTSLNLDDDEEPYDDFSSTLSSSTKPFATTTTTPSHSQSKPLETLLLSKNRKLQDELTTLRVAHDELSTGYRKLGMEEGKLREEVERLGGLNEKLEEDLSKVQLGGGGVNGSSNGGGVNGNASAGGLGRQDPLASLNLGKKDSSSTTDLPLASSSSITTTPVPTPSPAPTPTPTHSSAETSILPIITSQRDRFRLRNTELEEELRKQFQSITETRNEIKALQVDNLKLYEKVRYLQSYREDGVGGGGVGGAGRVGVPSAVARKDEELGKYRGIYEEHMNPFEKFRGRERLGALQALNPFDKLVLHAANFILGNRVARNLFVLYAMALHIFLFFGMSGSAISAGDVRRVEPPGAGGGARI